MAKSQLRGNRELKKPKKAKKAPAVAVSALLSQGKPGPYKQAGKK
ncbi:MAG TPA: hypothetical protein VN667_05000 [Burkholderiales bacterium]|nr:hypothetical protein [Burkholderiales bacterium]